MSGAALRAQDSPAGPTASGDSSALLRPEDRVDGSFTSRDGSASSWPGGPRESAASGKRPRLTSTPELALLNWSGEPGGSGRSGEKRCPAQAGANAETSASEGACARLWSGATDTPDRAPVSGDDAEWPPGLSLHPGDNGGRSRPGSSSEFSTTSMASSSWRGPANELDGAGGAPLSAGENADLSCAGGLSLSLTPGEATMAASGRSKLAFSFESGSSGLLSPGRDAASTARYRDLSAWDLPRSGDAAGFSPGPADSSLPSGLFGELRASSGTGEEDLDRTPLDIWDLLCSDGDADRRCLPSGLAGSNAGSGGV